MFLPVTVEDEPLPTLTTQVRVPAVVQQAALALVMPGRIMLRLPGERRVERVRPKPDQVSFGHHSDPVRQRELVQHARVLVRRSLELIRDQSTLNVRILTRSPLAREDFDLFRSFGDRLVFGISLPTLRNDLSRVYEPKAPAPTQRLATLRAARNAGLPVFVALAPTCPECDEADLRTTLRAVAELAPITVFHEPINIRAENVARIAGHAHALGVPVNTDVFATRECWQEYALNALQTVELLATEAGLADRLHLWPDKSLGSHAAVKHLSTTTRLSTDQIRQWLHRCWNRISEWPFTASSASRPA